MENGQDLWSQISSENALCDGGTMQSPIIISRTETKELPKLIFNYRTTIARVLATEQMVRLEFNQGNTLSIDKKRFRLIAAEFHSPSEHMIREVFYPLEIQLIHEDDKGHRLHLAIFADYGNENAALKDLLAKWPQAVSSTSSASFNPLSLLPSSFGYYSYSGSLTSPPCTEGVEWRVLKRPIQLSRSQFQSIINLHGRSARLEQPIYNRTIYETTY